MAWYSIEPRTRKYVKGYRFLSFARNVAKEILNAGLDALKNASKKVVHKVAEAKHEFIGKNCWQNCKTKTYNWWKSKKCWGNNSSARKKRINFKRIKKINTKKEHYI